MKCSLIITTYNWVSALELVILSTFQQSNPPIEVIIADDGSKDETRDLIQELSLKSPFPIIHSWHEDRGFRAAKSRNRAIAKAKGEYIVIIDGDMILHKDFVLDHLNFAKSGYFVQGGRIKLNSHKADEIITKKQYVFKPFERGIKNKRKSFRSQLLFYLFSGRRWVKKLDMVQTCNMAFFKNDCVNVNGFNEDFFGWGREDSEFAARLLNFGIKRRDIRYKALAYHIHHKGNSRNMLETNHQIYLNTINNALIWSDNGIDKYLNKISL